MKKGLYFLYILVFALNLSWGEVRRVGILTDNFDIVTQADLDEEEKKCGTYIAPFPPSPDLTETCAVYWQCLSTREILLNCEEDEPIPDFWIRDGNNIHHYLTRRNFGMNACLEWLDEWKEVMRGEDAICLSGDFIGMEDEQNPKTSSVETHYYWIIDRMKSHHSEWSYFYRGNIESELQETKIDIHAVPHITAPDRLGLLNKDDIAQEKNDHDSGPVMQSSLEAEKQWESYNQWLCFDKDNIELTRVDIEYDGKIKSLPQINAWTSEHYLEISLSADTEDDNDRTFSEWQNLSEGMNQICIYAAHLQYLYSLGNRQSSLWIISKLKTEFGYWSE